MEITAIFFLVFFWGCILTAIVGTLSSLLRHQRTEK